MYLSSAYDVSGKATRLLFKEDALYMTYMINNVDQWTKAIPWDIDDKFTEFHFDHNHRPYLYNAKGISAGNETELFMGSYEIDTTNYSYLFFSPQGDGTPGIQMNYLKNNQLVTNKYLYWHNDWRGGRYVVNVGQNQTYVTPIPVNNGTGGGGIILLWSIHWSSGNDTGAGIILIRTGYDGGYMEVNPLHTLGLAAGRTYTDYFSLSNDGVHIKIITTSYVGAGRFCFYHDF